MLKINLLKRKLNLQLCIFVLIGFLASGCDYVSDLIGSGPKSKTDTRQNTEFQNSTDNSSTSHLSELVGQLDKQLQNASKVISDITPRSSDLQKLTTDELKKLYSWEYKVVTLKRDLSQTEIESTMAALGQDRWECFQVENRDFDFVFFMKRRPETYLRYIPRWFP